MICFLFLIECLLITQYCHGEAPGLGLVVTKNGFVEISNITREISEIIPNLPIPDIGPFELKETYLLVDYDMNITLHNVKIHTLNITEFSLLPSADSGLSILLKMSVSVETVTEMKGKMVVSFIPINIDTSPKVLLDIVDLDCAISFKLKKNATGNFALEEDSLESVIKVSKLKIKFLDTPEAWLLNILRLLVSWGKNLIVKEINKQLPSIIEQVLNAIDLELRIDIEGYSNLINLHLVYDPVYTDDYLALQCNGTVGLARNNGVYPRNPVQFPSLQQNLDNMLYTWISNYTINSAIWAYYTANLLKLVLSPYNLPDIPIADTLMHLLNTNFYEYILPPLYRYFPNKNLTMNISTCSLPALTFYSDVIGVSLNLTLDLRVNESNKFTPVFKVIVTIEMTSSVNITNYQNSLYLQPKVIGFKHNLQMVSANSILGNIHKVFEILNKLLYDPFFVSMLNKLISRGYNLTSIIDQLPIQVLSPDVKVLDGFILVDTSFRLKPVLFPKYHFKLDENYISL